MSGLDSLNEGHERGPQPYPNSGVLVCRLYRGHAGAPKSLGDNRDLSSGGNVEGLYIYQ